jgi:glutamate racemase
MNKQPIGIFDSGIGGTTIWRELRELLPFEDIIYLADSKNAPYGDKTRGEILQLSVKNTDLLLEMGCKLVVVACNTATTNAIDHLRNTYDIPFIGIEPAIKPAALNSKTGTVGVLATKGTLSSALFHSTSKNHASDIEIVEQVGTGLVSQIENGQMNTPETESMLKGYLTPMIDANIDHLVLGCTHYPYLLPLLKKLLPKDVRIIDCGVAVARQTNTVLENNDLLNSSQIAGNTIFYSNTALDLLKQCIEQENTSIEFAVLDF